MQKYKVLVDTMFNDTEHKIDDVVELDSANEVTINLQAEGIIVLIIDESVTAKYEVVKGPIANRKGERFLVGNVIELPVDDELTKAFLEKGMIVPEGTVVPVEEEKKAEPVEESTITDKEPRPRYRGQIVISESERTVGEQTFKHIRCADGAEYDLTDLEYKTEVHVSYPPIK